MTDSSSKLLQIQGTWYQERKPKKIQNLSQKKKQKLFWIHNLAVLSHVFPHFPTCLAPCREVTSASGTELWPGRTKSSNLSTFFGKTLHFLKEWLLLSLYMVNLVNHIFIEPYIYTHTYIYIYIIIWYNIIYVHIFINIPPERYRREKMIKRTKPSQRAARFEHSKPIKKKLRLLLEWQPFHHFSLKKRNRNFFSHFLQRFSGGFHQVFPCAPPPALERAHAFPYLRIAHLALFRYIICKHTSMAKYTNIHGLRSELDDSVHLRVKNQDMK